MRDKGVVVIEELDRVDVIFRAGFREVILYYPILDKPPRPQGTSH